FTTVSPKLFVDGVDVTADPHTTIVADGTLHTTTVTYDPTLAPAALWDPNSRHDAMLTYSDSDTPPVSAVARQTLYVTPVVAMTPAGSRVFIEAEDFKYDNGPDAGQFFDFPTPNGAYNGLAARHHTDYHEAGSNPDSPLYRVLAPPNGISVPGA